VCGAGYSYPSGITASAEACATGPGLIIAGPGIPPSTYVCVSRPMRPGPRNKVSDRLSSLRTKETLILLVSCGGSRGAISRPGIFGCHYSGHGPWVYNWWRREISPIRDGIGWERPIIFRISPSGIARINQLCDEFELSCYSGAKVIAISWVTWGKGYLDLSHMLKIP
jgi:hypothetical protein